MPEGRTAALEAGRPGGAAPDARTTAASASPRRMAARRLPCAPWCRRMPRTMRRISAGPLATDYRRGSVGANANRENNGARDLSDGLYFRRARIGVEGMINRDFGYRFVTEFGGGGTEGPARINDAWVSYSGFAPVHAAARRLRAARQHGRRHDCRTKPCSSSARRRRNSRARSAAPTAARPSACAAAASAGWRPSRSPGRTLGDAEVFDSQSAVVARGGGLRAHRRGLQPAPRRVGHLGTASGRRRARRDRRALRRPAARPAGAARRQHAAHRHRPYRCRARLGRRHRVRRQLAQPDSAGGGFLLRHRAPQRARHWTIRDSAAGTRRRAGCSPASGIATTPPPAPSRARGRSCPCPSAAAMAPGNSRCATATPIWTSTLACRAARRRRQHPRRRAGRLDGGHQPVCQSQPALAAELPAHRRRPAQSAQQRGVIRALRRRARDAAAGRADRPGFSAWALRTQYAILNALAAQRPLRARARSRRARRAARTTRSTSRGRARRRRGPPLPAPAGCGRR